MKSRTIALSTSLLAAGVLIASATTAHASLPSGTTTVVVTQGNVSAGVNGHLHPAASIAGNIKSAVTGAPLSAAVSVYLNGAYAASGFSNASTGHYEVDGLF